MGIRWAFAVLAAVTTLSCGGGRGPGDGGARASLAITERIGWTHGACLAIANPSLVSGTPVVLVILGEPQVVRTAKVQQATKSATACPSLTEGRATANIKTGVSFYLLETQNVEPTEMGIGIVAPPPIPEIASDSGLVRVDLNHDGHKQVFSSCMTTEGIRFSVWNDKAYRGQPVWSAYYYLGYESTPSCPAP